MKELKDTIRYMVSEDYKERFVAEYQQLKIRYEKLKKFCNKIEVSEMMEVKGPEHDCPLFILQGQLNHMERYLDLLEKRALIEEIEIDD